jgi:hypothetical protein
MWDETLKKSKGDVGSFTCSAIDLVHATEMNDNFFVEPDNLDTLYIRCADRAEFEGHHIEEIATRAPHKCIELASDGGADPRLTRPYKRKITVLHEALDVVVEKLRAKGLRLA